MAETLPGSCFVRHYMIVGVSGMIEAKYRFWGGFFFSFILVVVWRVCLLQKYSVWKEEH